MTVIAPADHRADGQRVARDLGPARAGLLPARARTTARSSRGWTAASRSVGARPVRDGRRRRARHERAASRARPSAAADLLAARGVRAARARGREPAAGAGRRPRRRARPRAAGALTVEAHYVNGGLGSLVGRGDRRARSRLPARSLRRAHGHRRTLRQPALAARTRTASPRAALVGRGPRRRSARR